MQYMQEVLGIEKSTNATNNGRPLTISGPAHGSKLVSADYHGAEVEVVRSRCAGRVGVKGIVIRDTKFTFVIVTEKDVVKSEFRVPLACVLYGYIDIRFSDTQRAYSLSIHYSVYTGTTID